MDTATKTPKKITPMLAWLRSHTKQERERLAEEAETSVMYLYQIGMGTRRPSIEKARLIEYASGYTISREKLLFPVEYMQ